jgi:hypothetical protein
MMVVVGQHTWREQRSGWRKPCPLRPIPARSCMDGSAEWHHTQTRTGSWHRVLDAASFVPHVQTTYKRVSECEWHTALQDLEPAPLLDAMPCFD